MLATQAFRLWLRLIYLETQLPECERGRLNKFGGEGFQKMEAKGKRDFEFTRYP